MPPGSLEKPQRHGKTTVIQKSNSRLKKNLSVQLEGKPEKCDAICKPKMEEPSDETTARGWHSSGVKKTKNVIARAARVLANGQMTTTCFWSYLSFLMSPFWGQSKLFHPYLCLTCSSRTSEYQHTANTRTYHVYVNTCVIFKYIYIYIYL